MAKKIFLIINFIFLILFIAIRLYISNNLIFKKSVITKKEFNNIISEKKEYKKVLDVKLNGESIPYDKTNDYYLMSQIKDTKYNGNISIEKFNIKILKPTKEKEELILNNKGLTILAYNNKYYKIINLKFTNFPILKLDNNTNEVIMYDNTLGRETLSVSKEFMSYRIRGSSSARQDKKSYKLNILNSSGSKKKVSLLNMRKDDDWILNSINFDKSYMIEKIGYHIWDNMNAYNIKLKYIELFIDDEYKGIYYLQEPADSKTYDANDDSLLVQVKRYRSDVPEFSLFDENLVYNTIIDEFELDGKISEEKQIELLRSFVTNAFSVDYSKKIDLEYDLNNIVTYNLYINLISAFDNIYKNEKVLFRNINGKYFIEIYPWDLDWSQNNENLEGSVDFFAFFKNASVPKKILKSKEYKDLIKEKYFDLRKTVYNEEYIFTLIDSYKDELDSSGAIFREESIWGKRDLDKSVENLKYFYTKRIEQLDTYYGVKNGI